MRLAAAGRRARARADTPAAVNLLRRALELMPNGAQLGIELDLAEALYAAGRLGEAEEVARQAASFAARRGDRPAELHARLTLAPIALSTDATAEIAELIPLAEEAISVFQEAGDDAGLVLAWYAICDVEQTRCHLGARNQALEQALVHAYRAGDERWTENILMRLATGYYGGPTPVEEALHWHAAHPELERKRPLVMEAHAGHEAMRGRFDLARSLYKEALDRAEELGDRLALANSGEPGWKIERLAGDPVAAEGHIRRACQLLDDIGERAWLASNAGILARALVDLGRYEEAADWSRRAEEMSAGDDVDAQKHWRQARARVLAERTPVEGERLAREAVALAEQTDMTSDHGDALIDLAEVLELVGKRDEALAAFEQALGLYERKGNLVMADRARSKLAKLSPTISP